MKQLKVGSLKLLPIRPVSGRMDNKFNRAEKLARKSEQLLQKLDRFIDHNTPSLRSQCALAVKVCILTGVRIGNEGSSRGELSVNGVKTYGITTLQRHMVTVGGKTVRLRFVGKKGVKQSLTCPNAVLCAQFKRLLQGLPAGPGNRRVFAINDREVRQFVRKWVGKGFKVKDFRTLFANCIATEVINKQYRKPAPGTKRGAKEEVREILNVVSTRLGNTPAMARRAYIDPHRLQRFIEQRSK